eukprot:jgi/Botrbrau1/17321/Bobra.0015s0069.1
MASTAQDLLDFIQWPCVEVMNSQSEQGAQNALKQGYRDDDGLFLESDTDEQLLIHIPFNQAVKLTSLTLKAMGVGGQAPRKVKLFTNRPSLGFNEATSFPAVQEFTLSEADLEGKPLQLKFVKFQNVTTLTIFIEDNQGDEETTKIQKIVVSGTAGETFNVAEIKKIEDH